MTAVFIDGQEGTTGLRIYERLSARKDIRLLRIDEARRKDPECRAEFMRRADVVFLCLPDAAAVEAEALAPEDVTVIDASTAHRTLPGWSYGFPELSAGHRHGVERGRRIAVPGCHASGFNAVVYPLVQAGLLPRDYPLVCHSLTGYSGGGKRMIAQYEAPGRDVELDSPRIYGLTQNHKHLREMRAIPGLSRTPVFDPIVADYFSGMAVTVPLFTDLLHGVTRVREVFEALRNHYSGQRLVRVTLSEEAFLAGNSLSGRDDMEICVTGNDERVLVTARFDNLGKGASGAAVQCMNLSVGVDECTGLTCE